ncbi:rhomboid family intramembrane serine protease [Lentilactobacillus sp. SPB1-3]|uniref:Rhomboid family intramembrane serine protease n=1 Tax=Lentilactobacillus terminaliae TaxID=3003483 RepID=A0ACD5DHS0_9LACO|nr:rhomboid family intramembrane serine protease [Lentilactobacillus sp. SPB1-3]MCZ0977116.1 rhomboid family intramembrane serine protease [Lentilactobacillus sp. SPB1-3]
MVVVFGIMTLSGGTENPAVLVEFGAKYNPLIVEGQYWRFITPIFIHIGFMHILMNGITLYFIGQYVENIFGHARFFAIFMISGIIGNFASFAFNDGISAGASTAIFGLFGAFLMLGESFQDNPMIVSLARTFLLFVALNIGMDLFVSGIDIAGHIGGLIAGFLSAYIVGVNFDKIPRIKRIISSIMLLFVAGAILYLGFRKNM